MNQCPPHPKRENACDTKTTTLQSLGTVPSPPKQYDDLRPFTLPQPQGNTVAKPSVLVPLIQGKSTSLSAPQHWENAVTVQHGAVDLNVSENSLIFLVKPIY